MKFELQRLRKEAGFKSAADFAARLGMPKDTYTGYEQGKNKKGISLALAWQFCDVLGEELHRHVSLDELAGRDSPRPAEIYSENESRLLGLYRDTDQRGKAAIMRTAEGEAGMEGPPEARPGPGAVSA